MTEYSLSTDASTQVYSTSMANQADTASRFEPTTPRVGIKQTTQVDEATQYWCEMFDFLCFFVLSGIITIAGIIGNGFSIRVMWQNSKKSVTSFLLLCLAVADDAVLVTWYVLMCPYSFTTLLHCCREFLGTTFQFMLAYMWPVASIAHMVVTWIMTLVALQRYVFVCLPQKAKKWTKQLSYYQIAAIWGVSIIFNIPRFFDDKPVLKPGSNSTYTLALTSLGQQDTFQLIYAVILYYILIYVIPLAVMCFCTYKLAVTIRTAWKKKLLMSTSNRDEVELTLTLIIVIVVFIVCQIINPLRRLLLAAIPKEDRGCNSVYFYISPLSGVGVLLNSAMNFVLYCICGRKFRRDLKAILSRKQKVTPSAGTSSGTAKDGEDNAAGTSRCTNLFDSGIAVESRRSRVNERAIPFAAPDSVL